MIYIWSAKSNPDCDKQDRPHRSLLQDFYSDKESTDITGKISFKFFIIFKITKNMFPSFKFSI